MSARTFFFMTTMTLGLGLSEEHEVEALIAYTYAPGSPATPPSYASGGDPPTDPEVEIQSIQWGKDGEQVPLWIHEIFARDTELLSQLSDMGAAESAEGNEE